jgi:hypothetical protein
MMSTRAVMKNDARMVNLCGEYGKVPQFLNRSVERNLKGILL